MRQAIRDTPSSSRAALQAAAPEVMPMSPAMSRTRAEKAALPSLPPQKVSADIPMRMWSGLQVMMSRTACGMVWRIRSRKYRNASSLLRSGASTRKRPLWNVTPGGRTRAKSCSTTVLVDGTITPILAR